MYVSNLQCRVVRMIIVNRLLDVLADRKAKKGLSGHVLINGRRQPQNFKCASAYVVQVSFVGVNFCTFTYSILRMTY